MSLEELKDKYDKIVKETLDKNKTILIESFIEYYGEEYREIIEKKYGEITFGYFFDWDGIELLIKQFSKQVTNEEHWQDLNLIFKKYKKEQSFFSKLFRRKEKTKIPLNFIGLTDLSVLSNYSVRECFFNILKNIHNPHNSNFSLDKNYRLVTFPIFSLNERAIIHEINHALVCEFMARIVDEKGITKKLYKSGIDVAANTDQTSDEDILEELLNDKASFDILNIFKRRGGDLSAFCIINTREYAYEHNFYLIDEFYESFKGYLKKARMTLNKNELVSRIGNEVYKKYANLVRYSYHINTDLIPKTKKVVLPMVNELFKEMKTNESNYHELTRRELEAYYNELRSLGHNIRVLNDLPDNDSPKLESSDEIRRK